MTIRAAPVAIALAIAAPHCVYADSAPGETIVVTATRTEIPLSDAIVPVTVISREDIELSLATDLGELLRFQAGIDIGRNGGPGQATSVFMRGTESNHTLVLIDGVRMNPGTLGGAAIQHIAPEMIERIVNHKQQRPGEWQTLEIPRQVGEQIKQPLQDADVILLDCLTMLVSNTVLEAGGEGISTSRHVEARLDEARGRLEQLEK